MIIGFIGGIGSGKTLSMTKFLLEMYQGGSDIFSNYKLYFPKSNKGNKIQYLDAKFFSDYTKSKFDIIDSCVAVDEAHVFIDSRNAMLKRNKIFSRFITQSRKRSVNFCYTTQDLNPESFLSSGQVEFRLRKLTDYIVMCEIVKINGVKYAVNQWCNQKGQPIRNKKPYLASPYYRYYNTNEIIDFDLLEEK